MVERQLPKLDVAGSIPVARSIFAQYFSQSIFSSVKGSVEPSPDRRHWDSHYPRDCQPPEITLATDFKSQNGCFRLFTYIRVCTDSLVFSQNLFAGFRLVEVDLEELAHYWHTQSAIRNS